MIRTAKELRAAARASLSGKWAGTVLMSLVYLLLMGILPGGLNVGVGSSMGNLLQLLLLPMAYGLLVAFLDNIRSGETYRIEQLFVGFSDYGRILGTGLLVWIYTFLWTLLLVVPGIIKSYSYALTYYILRDHPELQFNGAIERSMDMMKGHKADLFCLQLTFIGWALLCILTAGIGLLWLIPYVNAAQAHFYEDVKADYKNRPAQAEQA